MKKIFVTLLVGLSAISVFGQEKAEDMSQRFFDAKIREFVYRLDIKDEQKADFVAVYQRYSEDMRATMGNREKPAQKPSTAADAATVVKERLAAQNKAQEVRVKYVDEFAAVLTPEQLLRFYDVETQIQHQLMDRKNAGHKGNNHGGKAHGFHGGPGAPGAGGFRPDADFAPGK
ncbi:MAG: Spy/CpxP family protein refolding chaperone [Bacteroidales bacterium]|nr:Spy/CpxP family protein refolding chaperone [Bacteroidales bacterium]